MTRRSDKKPFSALGRLVVPAGDPDTALAFYRGVLGFGVLHDSTEGAQRYLHVGVPGQEGVGLWLMPAADGRRGPSGPAEPSEDRPLLVLYTDDLGMVGARLREHGVRVWDERADDHSRSLHFADPDGNVLIAAQLLEAGE